MHRLFVAIRPPPLVRARLIECMGGIENARWQDEDQLHLTLRFIGAVERPVAEDVAATLGTVSAAPLEIALSGVGRFDKGGRSGQVWAGVSPHDGLAALHRKIDNALVRIGLAPERRAYLPHITIARLKRAGDEGEPFLRNHADLPGPAFAVTDFRLYESTLAHSGAHYDCIARYPLG